MLNNTNTNLNNNKGEVEMTSLNNNEVRSMVYNNGLNPVVNVSDLDLTVNPVMPVDLTLEAEKALLKSLNKKNSKEMKKWYKQYGMNLCTEEMTWKHLENWFTRNIIVKPVIHDIPLDCRGDEHIKAIIERKIQEDLMNKDSKNALSSNPELEELVRDEMAKLDEELNRSNVLNRDNKHMKMYRRGQVQCFDMLKLSIDNFEARENDTNLYVNLNTGMKITGTESNVTFKFSDGEMLTDLMIVKLKYDEDDTAKAELAEAFIKRGIIAYDNNGYMRRFKCFLITPSQSRSSNIWICPEERLVDYRRALCNGVEFEGNLIDVHKLETRMALGASNGYILGQRDSFGNVTSYYEYKFIVVDDKKQLITKDLVQNDDKEETVNNQKVYVMNGIKELYHNEAKELYEQYLEGKLSSEDDLYKEKVKPFIKETTDGFGLVDIRLCAHWAYELGVINRIEMNYFIEHFNEFNKEEMQNDSSLWLIFNKIPTAYQIRYQFYKGLLVVADLVSKGIEESIVFTKGMEKREEAPVSSGAWRICGYNKKKSEYATLTSQSVEALGLSFGIQKKMAKISIAFLTEAVKSVEGVMELCAIRDEDEDNNSMESQLMAILNANPKAFISEYVQKMIMKLVEKRLFGLCRGKFIIHGTYYYMINDPRQILDEETLKEGEFYLNGVEQDVTLVRYPCVNRLEPQRVTLTACDDLWYLRDLMIFNPYDGTWCAMGGADFDGDICLAIFDKYLVDLTKSYGFITDIVTHKRGKKESEVVNNYEARAEVYSRLHKGSNVGNYSKLHSRTVSRIYHECSSKGITAFSKEEHLERSVMWTFVIGKEIDKAKTYENFIIPQELEEYAKFYPIHLNVDRFVRDGQYNASLEREDGKPVFHSNCPRGMFFKWLQKEYGFFAMHSNVVLDNILGKEGRSDEKKFLDMISTHVSLYRIDEISKDMRMLYDNYVTFNQNMVEKYENMDMTDDSIKQTKANEYKAKYNYFAEQFEIVCEANKYDKCTAAYALAKIPYEIDQRNVGSVYPVKDELTGLTVYKKNYNKRSKSCAFLLAEKYMLKLIRASRDNTTTVEIPDVLNGTEVVVKGDIITINGISYLFDKLVDGTYTAITNRRCSYIVATRDQLRVKELDTDDRINEQSSSLMTMAQYKDKVMEIRTKHQFPLTICKSEEYGYTTKEVFEAIAGKEFGIGAIDLNGTTQAVIAMKNDEGEYEIVCGLLKCSRALVGRIFCAQEDILSLVKLTTNSGKKAKTVLFNATEVGFDEELSIDETIVISDNYEITDKDMIREEDNNNDVESLYMDNDCICEEEIEEAKEDCDYGDDCESIYCNDEFDYDNNVEYDLDCEDIL